MLSLGGSEYCVRPCVCGRRRGRRGEWAKGFGRGPAGTLDCLRHGDPPPHTACMAQRRQSPHARAVRACPSPRACVDPAHVAVGCLSLFARVPQLLDLLLLRRRRRRATGGLLRGRYAGPAEALGKEEAHALALVAAQASLCAHAVCWCGGAVLAHAWREVGGVLPHMRFCRSGTQHASGPADPPVCGAPAGRTAEWAPRRADCRCAAGGWEGGERCGPRRGALRRFFCRRMGVSASVVHGTDDAQCDDHTLTHYNRHTAPRSSAGRRPGLAANGTTHRLTLG